MLHHHSNLACIDRNQLNSCLPKLSVAPDSVTTSNHRSLVMPILTPAPNELPKLLEKEIHKAQNSTSSIYSITYKSQLESIGIFEYPEIKQVASTKPRTKVTSEEFNRISNIGFSSNTNGETSFRCYSDCCNYKVKSKEKFFKHLRDYHRHNSESKNFKFCHLCQSLLLTTSIIEEFQHMENFHLKKASSIKDSQKEQSYNNGVRTSIDSGIDVDLMTNIKQEKEVDVGSDVDSTDFVMSSNKRKYEAMDEKNFENVKNRTSNNQQYIGNNPTGTNNKRMKPNLTLKIVSIESVHPSSNQVSSPEYKTLGSESKIFEESPSLRTRHISEPSKSSSRDPIHDGNELHPKFRVVYKQKSLEESTSINSPHKTRNSPNKLRDSTSNPRSHMPQNSSNRFRESPYTPSRSPQTPIELPHSSRTQKDSPHRLRNSSHSLHKNVLTSPKIQSPLSFRNSSPRTPTYSSSPSLSSSPKINSSPSTPISSRPGLERIRSRRDSSTSSPIVRISRVPSSTSTKQPKNLNILKARDMMCWVTDHKKLRSNEKYEVAYKNMLNRHNLIALFKCMGKKCSYTTDDCNDFMNHIVHHECEVKNKLEWINRKYAKELSRISNDDRRKDLKLKEMEEKRRVGDCFFYCSYCYFSSQNAKQLVHHVYDLHRRDIYVCGFCFFRSCVKQTCLQHILISHKTESPILIYEYPHKNAYEPAKQNVMQRLHAKRKQNVPALRCKICDIGYYLLPELLTHCERDHASEEEKESVEKMLKLLDDMFKKRAYGMYQCLFCCHGSHNEDQMMAHLVEHPSEFGYYCLRDSNSKFQDPDYFTKIESTTLVEVKNNVKVIEFDEEPEVLSRKNYKEILDSELQEMLQRSD